MKTARTPLGAGQSGSSQSGFKIGAARRLGFLKRRQGHAGFVRAHGARQAVKVHLEALGVEDLRQAAGPRPALDSAPQTIIFTAIITAIGGPCYAAVYHFVDHARDLRFLYIDYILVGGGSRLPVQPVPGITQ